MKKKKFILPVFLFILSLIFCGGITQYSTVSVKAATTTKKQTGFVMKNGSWYYYDKNGKKVKGIRKIGKYTYIFDSKYTLVKNKKYYKYNASTYYRIDTQGRATKLSQVETLAAIRLQKCGGNLRKAFNWSASLRYNGNYKVAKKNQTYYGIYGFRTGSGDCYVMASTFYWMAKVAGYNAHYVTGYVNKGKGNGPHAWVEIKVKNNTYVYDPNFQKEYGPKGYTGYAVKYGQKGTLKYIKKKVY